MRYKRLALMRLRYGILVVMDEVSRGQNSVLREHHPRINVDWCAQEESNHQPSDS